MSEFAAWIKPKWAEVEDKSGLFIFCVLEYVIKVRVIPFAFPGCVKFSLLNVSDGPKQIQLPVCEVFEQKLLPFYF